MAGRLHIRVNGYISTGDTPQVETARPQRVLVIRLVLGQQPRMKPPKPTHVTPTQEQSARGETVDGLFRFHGSESEAAQVCMHTGL